MHNTTTTATTAAAPLCVWLHAPARTCARTRIRTHTQVCTKTHARARGAMAACVFNGDSMHHSFKGSIAIFLSGVKDAEIQHTQVDDFSNTGAASTSTRPSTQRSHSQQVLPGYRANNYLAGMQAPL